jgi:ferredoxin
MPIVTFLQDKITIEVPLGTPVMAAVEQAKATLPFGCRLGSCGTCRCIVVVGAENVNALTQDEEALFENLTHVATNERLACQLIINGDVSIQA